MDKFKEWYKKRWSHFVSGYLSEYRFMEKLEECWQEASKQRFAKGFRKGQESVKRRNKSGCCCIINDNDEIESLCGLHAELIKEKIENFCSTCIFTYSSGDYHDVEKYYED